MYVEYVLKWIYNSTDPAHRKSGQEVDQGLALILLKRHLDLQQEAGMHPFKMSDFVLIPNVSEP